MLTNIFDTHAHYDDEAFRDDVHELLSGLPDKGVTGVVTCGTNLISSARSLELAKKYDFVYAALGYHPENIGDERKGDLELIAELLSNEKKAVAIGEIGLDYYYDDGAPREEQIDLFERQLELAKDLDLPVIIHDRDAHGDTLEILKRYRPKGVVHCFSGSFEMAREVIKLGMFVGMGGVVTFKNARKAVDVVSDIPLDRLVLETDCPYLAPVPFRGKRNDSSLIAYVASVIGEIRDVEPQKLLDITCENAHSLYNI